MSLVDAAKRMEFNLNHFMSNYAIVFIVAFLYAVIFRPSFLFLLTFLGFAGYLALYKTEAIQIGDYTLQGRAKSIIFFTFATLVTFFFAGTILFGIITFSVAVILIHSILHGSFSDPNHPQLHAASAAIVASTAAKISEGIAVVVREGKALAAAASNAASGKKPGETAQANAPNPTSSATITDTAGDMEMTSLKSAQGDLTESDIDIGAEL